MPLRNRSDSETNVSLFPSERHVLSPTRHCNQAIASRIADVAPSLLRVGRHSFFASVSAANAHLPG